MESWSHKYSTWLEMNFHKKSNLHQLISQTIMQSCQECLPTSSSKYATLSREMRSTNWISTRYSSRSWVWNNRSRMLSWGLSSSRLLRKFPVLSAIRICPSNTNTSMQSTGLILSTWSSNWLQIKQDWKRKTLHQLASPTGLKSSLFCAWLQYAYCAWVSFSAIADTSQDLSVRSSWHKPRLMAAGWLIPKRNKLRQALRFCMSHHQESMHPTSWNVGVSKMDTLKTNTLNSLNRTQMAQSQSIIQVALSEDHQSDPQIPTHPWEPQLESSKTVQKSSHLTPTKFTHLISTREMAATKEFHHHIELHQIVAIELSEM